MELSDIEASLSHGRFFTGKWVAFLYFSLIISLLLPLVTIAILIVTFTIGMDWTNNMIIALIIWDSFSLLLFVVSLILIGKNSKLRKEIILWLEDTIETKAYSKKIRDVRLGFQPKQVKIQISFNIDGIYHTKESAGKMMGGGNPVGYHKILAKYVDKEINILYSPKYDEVLILKEQKK